MVEREIQTMAHVSEVRIPGIWRFYMYHFTSGYVHHLNRLATRAEGQYSVWWPLVKNLAKVLLAGTAVGAAASAIKGDLMGMWAAPGGVWLAAAFTSTYAAFRSAEEQRVALIDLKTDKIEKLNEAAEIVNVFIASGDDVLAKNVADTLNKIQPLLEDALGGLNTDRVLRQAGFHGGRKSSTRSSMDNRDKLDTLVELLVKAVDDNREDLRDSIR